MKNLIVPALMTLFALSGVTILTYIAAAYGAMIIVAMLGLSIMIFVKYNYAMTEEQHAELHVFLSPMLKAYRKPEVYLLPRLVFLLALNIAGFGATAFIGMVSITAFYVVYSFYEV